MSPEIAGSMAVVGAMVTAIGAALGFFFRGQIRTTSADKLWDAAEGMRQEQREEIKALEERVRGCEQQRIEQATSIMSLKEADAMKDKKIDSLIREAASKDKDIEYLTRRVSELEKA